jgi:hypothetical protein
MRSFAPLLGAVTLLAAAGCSSDSADGGGGGGPSVVFADNFGAGVSFQGFAGSTNDVSVDAAEKHSGATSLRISVPAAGFAGGAFPAVDARNLSGYDALTFWAKASKDATLDVAGFGVDNTPITPFKAERGGIPLTTAWTRFVLPIPLPAKLTAEKGLFHFAEGTEGVYTIWLDDVQFEKLPAGTLGAPEPAIATESVTREVGETAQVHGTAVTFPVDGSNVTMSASPRYFTFASSDGSVASVDADGLVDALAVGTTDVTATLGAVPAAGTLSVTVALVQAPVVPAPEPTHAATDVISLFSDAYTNVAVDTWSAVWDNANLEDVLVEGDNVKKYTLLGFAGVEFVGANVVDATAMTHFHLDTWSPNATEIKVKLVDFGADGAFGGVAGDADTEHEVTLSGLATGDWVSHELALADFTGLAARAHLAQLILSAPATDATVYVDNVYFRK